MNSAFYLAIRSLWWHRSRSLAVIFSLAIIIWLPATLRIALNQFRSEISARALSTPIVIGAPGSRIDLVMHSLYFRSQPATTVTMAEHALAAESVGVTAVPLHMRFTTRSQPGAEGAPIVGTTPEYFTFRRLTPQSGELPALLGECVLGADYAERSGLGTGDTVLSAPRNALNLAGDYPLRMLITGVLARNHSPDDDAVFTDLRTAWVIEGIGHGHQNVDRQTDPSLLLSNDRDDAASVTAGLGVLPYLEITDENRDSFHFHGNASEFPLTAVLAVPVTERDRIKLLGRFSGSRQLQCISPPQVIEELLSIVFRIEQFVLLFTLAAAGAALLLLALVLNLSLKLRAAEMQTMFRLGCSRLTILRLQSAEVLLLLTSAAGIAVAGGLLARSTAAALLQQLLL
ncbi:MAG: ABC transporter permease [Planctomyces sp.]|jgi:putative ABC transport system permease protein